MVNKNNFDFMDRDCPKSVFLVQKRKTNITIEFYIIELV